MYITNNKRITELKMNDIMNIFIDDYEIHPITYMIKDLYDEYESDYYEVISGSRLVIRNGNPCQKYYYRDVTFVETNISFTKWFFVRDTPEYSKW